jgi:hypothetical protein
MPPSQGRGLRIAQAIEEALYVLGSRMVQHRSGQRALTVKFDLRRSLRPGHIEHGFIALVIVEPDEDAATLADAQVHGSRESLEIAGVAGKRDGDQRSGGGETFTGHGGGPDLLGDRGKLTGLNVESWPEARAPGRAPGIAAAS